MSDLTLRLPHRKREVEQSESRPRCFSRTWSEEPLSPVPEILDGPNRAKRRGLKASPSSSSTAPIGLADRVERILGDGKAKR